MAKTYIDRAAAVKAFHDALDGGYVLQYDAQTTKIINDIKPADVWPREEVLQAIVLGLRKAGMTIGGRVHQCIYDALPK